MQRKGSLVLDKKDKHLLYLLDVNARTPFSELGKKTRISKQLVKYRIERLQKEGIVKGYYPLIDHSKLGFIPIRVYIKFTGLNPSKKKEIIDYLSGEAKVWIVGLLSGKWDLVFGISIRKVGDFHEFWDKFLEFYLQFVKSYSSSIYSPIYHYSTSYLIDSKDFSRVRIIGEGEKADFDSKDILILKALSLDARSSLLDISSKVRLSPKSVHLRIKRMESAGIIQGYRALVDLDKLGYEHFKVEIRLVDYRNLSRLLPLCHSHPNIYEVNKTIGNETIELEFHVRSINEMNSIIGSIENSLPNTVGSVDYLQIMSIEKITFMPDIK
jgi:Lrp/AsnC family transcriptional regulator, leucine-responsive regulatory protein